MKINPAFISVYSVETEKTKIRREKNITKNSVIK